MLPGMEALCGCARNVNAGELCITDAFARKARPTVDRERGLMNAISFYLLSFFRSTTLLRVKEFLLLMIPTVQTTTPRTSPPSTQLTIWYSMMEYYGMSMGIELYTSLTS